MGCDIHTWIETRQNDQSPWRLSKRRPDDGGRNYYLFAVLAGSLRIPEIKPLFPARGIPEDASDAYKKHASWGDAHTHHWLNLDEITAAIIAVDDSEEPQLWR